MGSKSEAKAFHQKLRGSWMFVITSGTIFLFLLRDFIHVLRESRLRVLEKLMSYQLRKKPGVF